MTLSINHQAIAFAGPNATICETSTYTLSNSTAQYYTSLFWTTNGTGTFNDATILHPTYTPSNADIAAGSVRLTLHLVAAAPCPNVTDRMTLFFSLQPIADAGPDATICQTGDYLLSGATAQKYTTVNWTTTGTGTFSDPASLNPVYTPSLADINAGVVNLILHANAAVPCSNVTDTMKLTIEREPVANAGPDATICQGSTYTLSGSSAQYYASLAWTTSGTGNFNDATILHPVYTPSPADILAGHVILTLTATATAPCTDVVTSMTLNISPAAYANAGGIGQICQGSSFFNIEALASSYSSVEWSTLGTGYFNNIHIVNPTYTPSPADILAGMVKLVLHVTGIPPCADAYDTLRLFITRQAVAYAGPDATICETSTYTLSQSTAQFNDGSLWTTSGTGLFNDATILHPVYTPSPADIAAGSVTLTLHLTADFPCADTSSSMTLTIMHQAVANAGPDATICEGSTYTMTAAVAVNYSFLEWITLGNGNFNNEHLLHTTYTPSPGDIAVGSVTLILHLTGVAPCVDANDTVILTINRQAIANAGPDATICETSTYTLSGSSAQYYTSLNWTTTGTGSFATPGILHPVYTPGAADIAAGSVKLILHLTSTAPCVNATDTMVLHISRQQSAKHRPIRSVALLPSIILLWNG